MKIGLYTPYQISQNTKEPLAYTISFDNLPAVFQLVITNRSNPSELKEYLFSCGKIGNIPDESIIIVSFIGDLRHVSNARLTINLSKRGPNCSWTA